MWLDFDPQLGHEQSGRRPHAGRPHTGAVLPKKTESIQRMIVRRALAGQCPTNPEQIIQWLEATARGWNRHPAPYMWGGKGKRGETGRGAENMRWAALERVRGKRSLEIVPLWQVTH